MEIIRAETMGMCFGVRRALAIARGIERPGEVTINGALVHNGAVVAELTRRGFRETAEDDRGAAITTREVLVTAHGISDVARRRLENAGHRLIDATCPLVMRAHQAAARLRAAGFFLVIIGRRDHVEVRGIVEDCDEAAVVESIDDVRGFDRPAIGVICQTTAVPGEAAALLDAIRRRNPGSEIRFIDTICAATRARQNATAAILPRVDLLVVVGGRRSHNTRRLVEIAAAHRKPVFQVEEASELDPEGISRYRTVGLTAGASTPDEVIDAVHRRLASIAAEATAPAGRVARGDQGRAGASVLGGKTVRGSDRRAGLNVGVGRIGTSLDEGVASSSAISPPRVSWSGRLFPGATRPSLAHAKASS
jgi:4-hydroxy-3-methylbut-2-enyl diphosphate reductase